MTGSTLVRSFVVWDLTSRIANAMILFFASGNPVASKVVDDDDGSLECQDEVIWQRDTKICWGCNFSQENRKK